MVKIIIIVVERKEKVYYDKYNNKSSSTKSVTHTKLVFDMNDSTTEQTQR